MTLRPYLAAPLLRRYADAFDATAHLSRDPLEFPHRYAHPADQEVVAFVAASLAFGRVASFRPVLERIFDALGPRPAEVLAQGLVPGPDSIRIDRAGDQVYRWLLPPDLGALLRSLGMELRDHGSLEAAFLRWDDPTTADTWAPLGAWLAHLRAHARGLHPQPEERARALAFLFPSTQGDAACKRQHLFLRWVVRSAVGGIDLGLWKAIPPSRLVVPCDVHVGRIGHALGLCERADPNHTTADEITGALRLIDPADPVRFDFAICHLGISGGCRARRIDSVCASCSLREACRWWQLA